MTDGDSEKHPINRRDFLKIACLGSLVLYDRYKALQKNINNFFNIFDLTLVQTTETEIPEQLKNIQIPERNEFLRKPEDIISKGIMSYNKSCNALQLPAPYYRKPDHYLDILDIVSKINAPHTDDYDEEQLRRIAFQLESILYNTDEPGAKYLHFGSHDILNVSELVKIDSGSGIVQRGQQTVTKIIEKCDISEITDEKKIEYLTRAISEEIKNTINLFENKKEERPFSTSALLEHYLERNRGDIQKSLWDVTLFFKLLSRNDIDTLEYNPTREGAEKLSSLFIDEFSTRFPLSWLLEHVPTDSHLNNSDMLYNMENKDFQPVNKAGIFYHAWNIMAWSGCMSPLIVELVTRGYYSNGFLEGFQYIRESNGPDKIEADLRVANCADKVADLLNSFKK